MSNSAAKLPLPEFLKILTSNNVAPSKAILAAGKIYKKHNTRSALVKLTDSTLLSLGIAEKDDRKSVLTAIRKANLSSGNETTNDIPKLGDISSVGTAALPSKPQTTKPSSSTGKKRKRESDLNNPLPDRPPDEGDKYGSFDFKEVLDPAVLKNKRAVVNRAPVLTVWATIVAERMGFEREEALSIASVYTEMNAISKGVSLGIYEKAKGNNIEASRDGAQPYVDLMGRRIPLYRTNLDEETTQWRALLDLSPTPPSSAYTYISNSLRQTAPFVVGALRLLAQSYEPEELNRQGFAMYADFRPDIPDGVQGWGKRGDLKCNTILSLMKKGTAASTSENIKSEDVVKTEDSPDTKKPRLLTLEEYEAALDADPTFDNVDLENIP